MGHKPPEARRSIIVRALGWPWSFKRALQDLLAGLALGAARMSVTMLFIAGTGHADVHWASPHAGAVTAALVPFALSAATEEVIFRGVVLRSVEKLLGSWGAIAAPPCSPAGRDSVAVAAPGDGSRVRLHCSSKLGQCVLPRSVTSRSFRLVIESA